MTDLVLTTFNWVPKAPRGFVRDLRIRWALEEAGLPYRVETTPSDSKGPAHIACQPFGQVPWLTERGGEGGDFVIFESGAILLHLGEKSDKLLPRDPRRRAGAIEWLFAALNSVEMATQPWDMFQFMGLNDGPAAKWLGDFVTLRLDRLEPVLADREWLAGDFSIADILMADVLRIVDSFDGLGDRPGCKAYLARALARPAFKKAHADQIAHFEAADAERVAAPGGQAGG